jgi:hypothetical protein
MHIVDQVTILAGGITIALMVYLLQAVEMLAASRWG